jgi:hypothetical protein
LKYRGVRLIFLDRQRQTCASIGNATEIVMMH